MFIFYFDAHKAEGPLEQYTFGCQDLESGLDTLTWMVNTGWVLSNIRVSFGKNSQLRLPADIFDGAYFEIPLKKLRQEWETILYMTL